MSRLFRIILAVLLLACLALTVGAVNAHADSQGAATVTASALYIRSEPSTDSAAVTCVTRGTVVIVTGSVDGWYAITYNGYSGYMCADYLSFATTAASSFGTGTVTGNLVNVRSGPSTSSSSLGSVNKGDTVTVTGVDGNWYQINYNGTTAYIISTYVSLGGSTSTTTTSTPTATPAPTTAPSATTDTTTSTPSVSVDTSVTGTGTITGNQVRFRSSTSTSSTILGVFSSGDTVSVTGKAGDWYAVTYNGTQGYVYASYVSLGSSSTTTSTTETITVTTVSETTAYVVSPVNFRTGPSSSYTSMQVLSTGTSVTIIGSSGNWYQVRYNGTTGYIFNTYLTTTAPSSSSTTSSSAGTSIVTEAKKYIGVPYVYGGTSPSGFDCSGFVYYVFRQCGYTITRTATAQNSVGSQVSRSNLQPGDIIIFYNSAKTGIGHSGIYIGNNQFIHASSGGGKVMISSLSETYYNTHYYSARRVVS